MKEGRKPGEKKWMKERGFKYIGTLADFKIPKWMDCTWRRVACGREKCKICGKIIQDRLHHIMKGEDPDDMKSIFEDAGNSLGGALAIIKQHAAEMGIDITNINKRELEEPPEPKKFLLYRHAEKWENDISTIMKDADFRGGAWLLTEAAADLGWYKNTLLTKTYRQLSNRWHLVRGDEYGEADYKCTKYVLDECVKILEKSLVELSAIGSQQSVRLKRCLNSLQKLKEPVLSI